MEDRKQTNQNNPMQTNASRVTALSQNHRIFSVGRDLFRFSNTCPTAGSPGGGYPGMCPVRYWISPQMGTPQPP